MNQLSAVTRVSSRDPTGLGSTIATHLAEHGAEITQISDTRWALASPNGTARIVADARTLHLETSASDSEMLTEMKYLLASHVGEFNKDNAIDIIWTGDGDEIASLPNVRSLKVVAINDLSPHIRRITFGSSKLKRFDTLSALHVKLLLPRQGSPLFLPKLSATGTVDWGSDEGRAFVRKYTIRHINPAAGTLDIDFVLHDHGGPGSSFATNAKVGDVIGMMGPGGGSARPADWNLFVGDETALPAIARLIEALPEGARGTAIIEVADECDEQHLSHHTNVEIVWLHRRHSANPSTLAERSTSIQVPETGSMFAWAGTEFETFRTIRTAWRSGKGIAKNDHLAVAYWRAGEPQA